ncbi:tetratricopeptide repeat protein [Paraferrimonas sp. SM1919]|uniref:tetratricopeptide repeat protein n=1 Tax=Paraferrimonas sp. SM1919 TaxID=2662263 RepID=UPI0013CFA928|nr:tetratricopeptide repeat protein [Paraferrimonas sp. SM1919]
MTNMVSVTVENIQQVVDTSMQQPLVFCFTSSQAPESMQMLGQLQTINSRMGNFTLAHVDCDAQPQIVQYFRIQGVPTVIILKEGQPVDAFSGMKSDSELEQALKPHLPSEVDMLFEQGVVLLSEGKASEAVKVLHQAYTLEPSAIVAKAYAHALLDNKQNADAGEIIASIRLEDQDGEYDTLKSKYQLALEAADSPEIRQLFATVEAEPENMTALVELAVALHGAGRNEEALEHLLCVLKKDLAAGNGEVRKSLMDILSALGQGDPLAAKYRRGLYSLLY